MYAVPARVYQPRQCDEKPEDFRKLGLGLCFKGSDRVAQTSNIYFLMLKLIEWEET